MVASIGTEEYAANLALGHLGQAEIALMSDATTRARKMRQFFPVARRFINWRALSLTLFFMLLVSLLWEATLAVPYNWWNFQPHQMMGLFIGAWSRLPIEEVCVWIAVTYATVIVFEVMKVLIASERTVRETLLGRKDAS